MLTVDSFAQCYNFSKTHGFAFIISEMGQDTGTQGDLLVEITFSETIPTELQLRWMNIG